MTRAVVCLVPALMLVASTAAADENEVEEHTCPFPDAPSDASSSSSSSYDTDDGDGEAADGWDVAAAVLSALGDSHEPQEPVFMASGRSEEWPEELGLHLDAAYASFDLSTLAFSDMLDTFAVEGSSVRLGRTDLAGGELGIELSIHDAFRVGFGGGLFGPIAGESGGEIAPGRFGRSATAEGLFSATGYAEALFSARLGPLSAFGGLRAGIVHSEVRIESSCGCNGTLMSTRTVLGPRVGVRTRLYRSVFLQASVFADATHLPDYVASVGVGVGNRGR